MSGTNNFLTQIRFSLRSLLLLTLARPRITLPGIAFPLLDVAALCLSLLIRCISTRGLPKPFRCISWHCPSLPLHIGAAHLLARSRLTFAFQSVPMQSLSITLRGIPLRFRCRSALRFAPLSLREPVHRLAVPCLCYAMPRCAGPCDSSPFPCITRPFDTVLCRC